MNTIPVDGRALKGVGPEPFITTIANEESLLGRFRSHPTGRLGLLHLLKLSLSRKLLKVLLELHQELLIGLSLLIIQIGLGLLHRRLFDLLYFPLSRLIILHDRHRFFDLFDFFTIILYSLHGFIIHWLVLRNRRHQLFGWLIDGLRRLADLKLLTF